MKVLREAHLEHGCWYWLHMDGPDGLVVMLGRFGSRFGSGFMLPDDGGETHALAHGMVHKWRVVAITHVEAPTHVGLTGEGVNLDDKLAGAFFLSVVFSWVVFGLAMSGGAA